MNFELGWRDVGIPLFAIAQHFSLFTFHYSLPKGTTIHFPKGPLFTPRREQAGLVFQDR